MSARFLSLMLGAPCYAKIKVREQIPVISITGDSRTRQRRWSVEYKFVAGMLKYSFNQVVPQDLYKSQNQIRKAMVLIYDRYTGSSLRKT